MRPAVSVLTCFVLSAMTAALADPATTDPSATAKAPAAAPSTAAPAATATPAAPAAAPHPAASATPAAAVEVDAAQLDQQEKHFLAEGYKIEMHNGEKYFCRREEQMGSRLGGQKQCATAQQLAFTEKDAQRQTEHAMHNQSVSPK
jgi:uncharacterized iron-regulated membrane protein